MVIHSCSLFFHGFGAGGVRNGFGMDGMVGSNHAMIWVNHKLYSWLDCGEHPKMAAHFTQNYDFSSKNGIGNFHPHGDSTGDIR